MRILSGAPGAGKGTQLALVGKAQFAASVVRRWLRFCKQRSKLGSPAGVEAKEYMDKGVLVPDPVLIKMFGEKLSSQECKNGFILDGFPRNLAQAKSLDELLDSLKSNLTTVINLEVDDSLLTERICGRWTCSNKACAAVYHVKFAPPKAEGKCDVCGAESSQRADDKEELVKRKIEYLP